MRKTAFFLYGIVAYVFFFVVFLYAIGFVGNLVVPKSLDTGAAGALGAALAIDAVLLTLFAVQHSGMARPAFKRWWTRIIPEPIERSTYVLVASAVLALIFALWRPLPGIVWHVVNPVGVVVLWALFALGWTIVLLATFMIGHANLFGLEQVWFNLVGRMRGPDRFRTPALYRIVRHPIMLGFFIAFWATPVMTVGHLLFAVATTGYILLAVLQLEERDLIAHFGDAYREYRSRVPAFIPFTGRRARVGVTAPVSAPRARAKEDSVV
ncbi:MAG TPA: isoprenylcysteine carboxylmethyltransferase family protein [Gemmatimonadaceae bacterium]|nr:isoprenylcysteine carboxylmethyltransferase family protein [Gemmatimonadaceae bacterium]